MANSYFQFKQFTIQQDRCAMKVTTDACLFGAILSSEAGSQKSEIRKVLDVGTGTGLLALMCAQKNPSAAIDAVEIDKETFEQATENAAASPWSDRVNIFHGDARSFSFPHQYDLIISNPPFYENELKSDDPKRNLALHGNELSLDELLKVIQSSLSTTGVFFLLLPYKKQDGVREIFEKYQFSLQKIIFARQSVKHDYFRMMIMGKTKTAKVVETTLDEISIWDEKQQYTRQFVELLKDYYLNL